MDTEDFAYFIKHSSVETWEWWVHVLFQLDQEGINKSCLFISLTTMSLPAVSVDGCLWVGSLLALKNPMSLPNRD